LPFLYTLKKSNALSLESEPTNDWKQETQCHAYRQKELKKRKKKQ